MPYDSISDLPKSQVDQYDHHQKEAFLKAFNHAYHEYHGDEGQAFAVAHDAAKRAGADEHGGTHGRRSSSSHRGHSSGKGKVNINEASADELEQVDGIGERTAQSIVDYRGKHGRFSSVDELDDVQGIGDSTLRRIRGRLTT